MSWSRSEPAEWMMPAYSTCFGVRLREGFWASNWARMSRLLSGVRSSWLMFARNSDLYLEASESCWARASSSCRACSIWRFFASMSRFCSASSEAFSSSSALERCSSSCRACNSAERDCSSLVSRCDSSSSSSVRALATMVLTFTPMVSTSCCRKSRWTAVNGVTAASSMTPRTCSSKTMGSSSSAVGSTCPSPEEMVTYPGGSSSTAMVRRLRAAWPTRERPNAMRTGRVSSSGRP